MNKKKIKNIEEKKPNGVNKSSISSSNFKIIIGIILIIISVFLFLSIISFSRLYEALIQKNFSEFVGSFSNAEVEKINSPENWMGLVGAYISFFFVNSVLGYFSLVFPV
jgi:S-DNA-T family DNA segregation ATPase FtsK/SpoIIIE